MEITKKIVKKTKYSSRLLNDKDILDTLNPFIQNDKDIQIADTYFISEYLRKEGSNKERIIKNSNLNKNAKKWLIPINHCDNHWILGVVNISKRVIVLYDSMKNKIDAIYYAAIIRDILESMKFETSDWRMIVDGSFRNEQPDGKSCGVFVIAASFINIIKKDNIVVDINMLINPWKYLKDIKESNNIEQYHFCNFEFCLK